MSIQKQKTNRDVVVIGGGITGLTTLYYLQKSVAWRHMSLRTTLIEASSRLGGQIITEKHKGFIIEGGPDAFVTKKPWAKKLCEELGLANQLLSIRRHIHPTLVVSNGALKPLQERSTVEGIAYATRKSLRKNAPLMTLKNGMGTLVSALVSGIKKHSILTNTHAKRIMSERINGITRYAITLGNGKKLFADAVVLAISSSAAADLLKQYSRILAKNLRAIPRTSSATISLGYKRNDVPHSLDSNGFVVPAKERKIIIACTWVSSKFSNRAPVNFVQLRIFIKNDRVIAKNDGYILSFVKKELKDIMGITAQPVFFRIFRWRQRIPQYGVKHLDRVRRIESFGTEGLFPAGCFLRGVGLADCIKDGKKTAKKIIHYSIK